MAKLDDVLKGKSSVAVSGHIRPDGDCIGSCLGVYNYIKNNYPSVDVDVYLQSFSDKFNFIRYSDEVKHEKTDKIYDLFIMLDSSSLDRLGEFTDMFNNAKETICIDHHISNEKYAMENIVFPKASSTCEVLYGLMDEDRIDNHIAEALYMGIVHDSGAFKYSNTSAETMNIAGKLMKKGIPFTSIIDNTFYTKTYVQNQILGRALLESVLFFDEKCIFSVVTQKEMDFYNISYKDLDGIVEQLRITKGVECAIFMYETGEMEFKVSMRSNEIVDVSAIAIYFGGGGHIRAAGFNMKGTLYDVINNISEQLAKQLS
ncbi:MAG: bifunctional oligoribonuclease/PAP phosphatase NrnA [Lachnospiraceae bacterium]|nr:bifunctional oligoribonuclease/PAP phosphatase NrnA [Lachnospiraceae bacterium]MDD6858349.1 bifunctional oligoribonuclease/PAP phosphatase NrnA [Lachnospiraceae bacterium]